MFELQRAKYRIATGHPLYGDYAKVALHGKGAGAEAADMDETGSDLFVAEVPQFQEARDTLEMVVNELHEDGEFSLLTSEGQEGKNLREWMASTIAEAYPSLREEEVTELVANASVEYNRPAHDNVVTLRRLGDRALIDSSDLRLAA